MLLGIANVMFYLHKHGIVNLDLKQENILTDENYYSHVCDFGLSCCFSNALVNSMQMTMTGQLGTSIYMAPEILCGEKKYESEVDVYSFEILGYEIEEIGVVFSNQFKNRSSEVLSFIENGDIFPKIVNFHTD